MRHARRLALGVAILLVAAGCSDGNDVLAPTFSPPEAALQAEGMTSSVYSEAWDGVRGLDSEQCGKVGDGPRGPEGWIHWIFATKGESTDASLTLGGTGSGTYEPGPPEDANTWHFYTPFFELDGLTAEIHLNGTPGDGGGLVISDYCPGVEEAELDVTATLDLVWTRDVEWDITKSVTPALWDLFAGDSGESKYTVVVTKTTDDEVSTLEWEVCVENLGPVEAQDVKLTVDLYKDGALFQNLLNEESLDNIADGATECEGDTIDPFEFEEDAVYQIKATATLDNGDPATGQSSEETANLDLTGEPEVTVTDSWEAELASGLTASQTFTYYRTFDCESYLEEEHTVTSDGYWRFPNTAEIVETGQSDDAYVDVKCYALEVTKDADTSFIRTHDWEIDKSVRTDEEEFVNGTPKVWLYPDESGDETAYWKVCVIYLGYEDSDPEVSGTISISNPAPIDAVINSVEDVLSANGFTDIDANIDFGDIEFPYTLEAGDTLELDYSAYLIDDFEEGTNTATAVQQNFDYSWELVGTANGTTSYSGSADVIVSDEPSTEVNKEVDVTDEMFDWTHPLSENGDVVTLGILNADDFEEGQEHCFEEYSEFFAWADYSPDPEDPDWEPSWEINNVAKVIGDDDEVLDQDDAKLKINWLDEELTVTKTVDTSYKRVHAWDIDKYVETENEYTVDEDTPKVWLFIDGSGNETATWNVCVTYEGYEDSDFVVYGTITIENTGDYDWDASIINIVDTLAGNDITIYLDEEYTQAYIADFDNPIVLAQGEDITLYYHESVDSKIEGNNEVTVTTTVRDYDADPVAIVWGEPAEEEYAVVNIEDVSDYFGTEHLGTLDAAELDEGEVTCFDYDYFFEYGEYDGPAVINNRAEILETEQYATAILKINIQEFIYESAWAKGDPNVPFCEYFSNWGWTNEITPGTYNWDLWAGAAQCDTSKGTLVGSVTVVYDDDGYVTVTFNVDAPYTLESTAVYAGYDMFPQQELGRSGRTRDTVAPGQYYNDGPFDGSEVYVIAHAVVGMPDPNFGP